LKEVGYAVQLAHDDKETTWEDHGFVRVKASDGAILAEAKDFQHNPFSSTVGKKTEEFMEKVKASGK